jgi:hypothetical protein
VSQDANERFYEIDPATGFQPGAEIENGLLICYHVFTDGQDERCTHRDEADRIYDQMLAENGRCARLYVERFKSEEDYYNDVLASEDCLRAYGDYPL